MPSDAVTKEDFRQLVDMLDRRFDGIDRRLDAMDGRLDSHQTSLVMLETLPGKIEAYAEAAKGMGEAFTRQMAEMDARLTTRIDMVERAVRECSRDINVHSGTLRRLSDEVADVRRRFDERDNLESLERRVTEIEKDLASRG